MSSIELVNVVLAGVYAYVVEKDGITAYSPALNSHVYEAGPQSKLQEIVRGDYTLCGVEADVCPGKPDCKKNPVLVPDDAGIERFDCYKKHFLQLRLPHPYTKFPLEPCVTGGIFRGKAADPLNQMDQFPALYAFVYRLKSLKDLALEPINGYGKKIPFEDLPANPPPNQHTANLFIYATLKVGRMGLQMDHSGHTRRAFHSLVDMFDKMELTIEIPDGFAPTKVDYELPNGLTKEQVENPPMTSFGKVNCQHSNVVVWNV